ncbi:MAG: hypothetical protein R3C32_01795 [Chloroflexota bacterium]
MDRRRLLPEDVNIQYTDSNARFAEAGVFTFNGADWQNAQYDADAPGKVGFFLFRRGRRWSAACRRR